MPVTIKRKNDYLYAFLKGEIDHHTAPAIREAIDDALSSSESAKILVIDFNEVSFMDSSGVGLVMGRYRTLSRRGAALHITGTSPQIYKMMRLAGMEKLATMDTNQKG